MEKLDVIASFDWMDKEEKVGSLGYEYLRGSDVFSFEFDKTWLKRYWKSHTNLTHAGKYFRPSKVKITSPTLPK